MSVSDSDLRAVQQVRDLIRAAVAAQQRWATFSQGQIDAVIDAMATAATQAAEQLARMAVEETGFGNVPDKIKKNKFSSTMSCIILWRLRPARWVVSRLGCSPVTPTGPL